MHKNIKIVIVGLALLVVAACLFDSNSALTRFDNAITIKEHYINNTCLDFDQVTLTASGTTSVQTDCLIVDSCAASVKSIDTGASATVVFCNIPTQSGTNLGKMTMNVDVPGQVASGSTVVNWIAVGHGRL